MGPWHLVCDDVRNHLLRAPCGFVADDTHYGLIAPQPAPEGSVQALLLDWLRREGAATSRQRVKMGDSARP